MRIGANIKELASMAVPIETEAKLEKKSFGMNLLVAASDFSASAAACVAATLGDRIGPKEKDTTVPAQESSTADKIDSVAAW